MSRVRWLCLLLLLARPVLAQQQQQASEARIDLIWLGDLGNTRPPTPPAGKVVLFVANGRLCQKDSAGATNCFAFGAGASGGGTVTSVGLSAPSQFTVTGSPVTTAGTITLAWAAQNPATFLAGPVSGPAAAPTFRSIAASDLPAPAGDVTGSYGSMSVTALHFGTTGIPLSNTAPMTGQCLGYTGTEIAGVACTGTVTGATVVYNTPSASTGFGTNIPSTTMITAGSTGNTYLVTLSVYQVTVGAGCSATKTSSATASVTFTDAQSNTSITVSSPTLTVTGNGSVGQNVQLSLNANVAANASLSYSVSSTTAATCTTVPRYYVVPSVIQVR